MLVGRAEERAILRTLVASVQRGVSAAIVLRGEPGIGKTALLDFVAESSEGTDVRRLAGLESESHLGFAAIHRLLVPYLGLISGLPAGQAQALRTAIGLADGTPSNSFMLGLAVLSLLDSAARDRALLCVIDDAQWLDSESVEILGFVARRLYAESVGMIFSVREPTSQPVLEGIPSLRLDGLGAGDAADLLLALAPGRVDRPVADQIAMQSRGNPLVIVEVSRELNSLSTPRTLLLDDPLPLGQRLERHFRQQISDLPDDCQVALLYAAAHPNPDSRLIWRALADQGIDLEAVQPAVDAGLVLLSPTFQFRHPLIRSAVYANVAGAERRHAHAVLGRMTDAPGDVDLRAWHLAAACTGPDEAVAAELELSAESARARGGYLSEAAYLARAAELTPEPSARATRLLSAAEAALTGGAPLRAQALLEAGLPDIHDPFVQARLHKLQANALHRAGRPGHDTPATLLQAAQIFAPIDEEMARQTMIEALEQTFIRGSLITGTTSYEVGQAALRMVTPTDNLTDRLLNATGTYLCSGYVAAAPLIRHALLAVAIDNGPVDQVPRWFALGQLLALLLWDEVTAHDWLVRCEHLARSTGAIEFLTMTLIPLSGVEATLGQLVSAEARIADVRELYRALGMDEDRVARMANARLLAWLGQDDAARVVAANTFEIGTRIGAGYHQHLAQLALTVVELGRGRYQEAYELSKQLIADDLLAVCNEALPNLIESAVRSDHQADAELALISLRTRALASGTPWALGVLARSAALLAPGEQPDALYGEALGHFGRTQLVTELARTHLLYGEWLRRQKRRSLAREQLRKAHDIFDDVGAAAFAARARGELEATGEHSSVSKDGLTPQEAQIARLAAAGSTNQEIASLLFISSHTVEYHLRKVFRKLDVSSRRQLTAALNS